MFDGNWSIKEASLTTFLCLFHEPVDHLGWSSLFEWTENLKLNDDIQAYRPLHSIPNNPKPNPSDEKLIDS